MENSLEMMKVDFEQRSQQVIQLALDRSKFLRIAIIIWGVPLGISSTLLFKSMASDNISEIFFPFSIISISFLLVSIANCIVLSAMLGNRNSSNLSSSGMNYIRSVYLYYLHSKDIIKLKPNLQKISQIKSNEFPDFEIHHSSSNDLVMYFIAVLNIIYSILGCIVSYYVSLPFMFFCIGIFLLSFIFHFIILRKISLLKAIKQS